MPFIRLTTTAAPEKLQALLPTLSKIAAQAIGKPEQYVMAAAHTQAMLMSGKPGPAALVEVRSIGGLGPDVNQQIARKVCDLLEQALAIPPERVFLNFTDVAPENWGWRGETFGR
jgi:phenylpyruvate tautomerase PptA (4-oxalocrotonate tautomerase family)